MVGILLAAFLMWWVLRGTSLAELKDSIGRASIAGLIGASVLNVGHNVFRAWRWKLLLRPVRTGVPFRSLFSAILVGYLVSWCVPGRLGEIVRPMLLSARDGVPLGPCIGSVVVDRLLDTAAVVALFAAGVLITPLEGAAAEHAAAIRGTAVVLGAGVAVFLVAMMLASTYGPAAASRLEHRGGLLRRLAHMVVSLSHGAQALHTPRFALGIVVHSLLAWLTICLATWVGLRAADVSLSFGAVLVILPMLVLGVAVPTPGGAGSYHGAMKLGLTLFGVAQVAAVSAAILVHLTVTIPVIVVGVFLLWFEGISWRDLIAGARQLRNLGDLPEAPRGAMESAS
ncbi:MAG: flippase-like domain-containing protein [bacterium]|nr:flippase-like domain-containing protein [bacterium]